MSRYILETERFLLRQFTLDDAHLLVELNRDPEVTRFTGDGPLSGIDEAESIIRQRLFSQYYLGLGRLAIEEKSSGFFWGWCGLKYEEEERHIDLGYRLLRSGWGRGIATETAKACISYGFEKMGIERIVAQAVKENTASVKVMEKCGMRFEKEEVFDGQAAVQYAISRGL